MRLALALLPLLAMLPACTQFPQLDSTITPALADAPYPDLVPLSGLTARAAALQDRPEIVQTNVNARLAALQARAARLRGPVIPEPTRSRMLRAIR